MEENVVEREVLHVIIDNYNRIFPAERKAADYVLKNPSAAVNLNVAELAKASGVSDATIVRMCHHLGYTGYYQFRLALSRDIGKKQPDELVNTDPRDILSKIFEDYSHAMTAIGAKLDLQVIKKCVELFKTADCVHIVSVGNTTNVARYMGFRMERLGVRCTYSELPEYYINHINLASETECVLAITKSGASKRVIDALKLARDKKMKTVIITAQDNSPAAKLGDYIIDSSGNQAPNSIYKGYSYLNEFAIAETLITFLVNIDIINKKDAIRPELLLAENKY